MKRSAAAIGIALAVALWAGCEESFTAVDDRSPAALVIADGQAQTGTVGQQLPELLVVEVQDDDGRPVAGATVQWLAPPGSGSAGATSAVSDDAGRASTSWTLHTVAGAQTLRATVSGVPSVDFDAIARPGPIQTITVAPAEVALAAFQETATLVATASDAYDNEVPDADFTWSSNSGAAAVSAAQGAATTVVTALGNGAAEVTAAAAGRSAVAAVTIQQQPAQLAIETADPALEAVGDTVWLSARVVDANGFDVEAPDILWSSRDGGVASVDAATGVVTAHARGAVFVVASAGAALDSVAVAVDPLVAAVVLSEDSLGFRTLQRTAALSAELLDARDNAVTDVAVRFASLDESVAEVDSLSGLVTAVGSGTTHVVATAEGRADSALVVVDQLALSLAITALEDTVFALGDTVRLPVIAHDSAGYPVADGTVAWSSSDTDIVSMNGGVPVSAWFGVSTLTASLDGLEAQATVFVRQPTLDEARALPDGTRITVDGVVSVGDDVLGGDVFFLQDMSAGMAAVERSGLSLPSVDPGDSVRVTGYRRLIGEWVGTEMVSLNVLGASAPPAPLAVVADQLAAGIFQGRLIVLLDLVVDSVGTDADGNTVVHWTHGVPMRVVVGPDLGVAAGFWAPGVTYDLTAIAATHGGVPALLPRSASDLPSPIRTVTFAQAADTINALGFTTAPQVSALDRHGVVVPDAPLTWSSEAPAIADVSPAGVVTAIGVGEALVHAAAAGFADTISVLSRQIGAEVTVTAAATALAFPASLQLDVAVVDSAGVTIAEPALDWSSSDTTIALVSDSGFVTTAGLGTATITAALAAPESAADGATIRITPQAIDAIDASVNMGCLLSDDGQAWCWGNNEFGQLGDGTDDPSDELRMVAGGHEFYQIDAGWWHACGVTTDYKAYCWGRGLEYQLAVAVAQSTVPVPVSGGHEFLEVAAGPNHSCGILRADSTAVCWGTDSYGEVGAGAPGSYGAPHAVVGGIQFRSLSTFTVHTCGVAVDGVGYCWGENGSGQAGDGSSGGTVPTPVAVAGGALTFERIEAGWRASCGITTDGETYCWGYNGDGQLGDGTFANSPNPVLVSSDFVQVDAGYQHTCALDAAGLAHCWGKNDWRQAGGDDLANFGTPAMVDGGRAFAAVTAGFGSTCGIDLLGGAYCWGDVREAPLGQPYGFADPQPVASADAFTRIDAGTGSHTCALRDDGVAFCWGFNRDGQLGLGSFGGVQATPADPVSTDLVFADLAVGTTFSCGLTAEGDAWCWGDNSVGALGDGSTASSAEPVAVAEGPWLEISASNRTACGIHADDQLAYCWGYLYGNAPAPVSMANQFATVTVGLEHACALDLVGAAWCWGWNNRGQVGNGTIDAGAWSVPTPVVGGHVFTQLNSGDHTTCGIADDESAWCWGEGSLGQLGNNGFGDSGTPVEVYSPASWSVISAGGEVACGSGALGVLCWGDSPANGSMASTALATTITGSGQLTGVSAGYRHSCGLIAAAAYCWGEALDGALGNGLRGRSPVPIAMAGAPEAPTLVATPIPAGASSGASIGRLFAPRRGATAAPGRSDPLHKWPTASAPTVE